MPRPFGGHVEVASQVDRGSMTIFGRDIFFRGRRFWIFTVPPWTRQLFVGGPRAGAMRAARVIGESYYKR